MKRRYFRRYPTKKAPVKFFDTDVEKGVVYRKTRFPSKEEQKTLQCSLFQNGSCRTPKSSPEKGRKKWENQFS